MAIDTLNETELMGRAIYVREDREEGALMRLPGAARIAGRAVGSGVSLFVGNLAYEVWAQFGAILLNAAQLSHAAHPSSQVTWQALKDHFKTAGDVLKADVMMDDATGRSKGCGIVKMASAQDAENAKAQLNDSELFGRSIFVREDREPGLHDQLIYSTGPGGKGGAGGGAGCKLFVGNLSYDTTWQDLKDLMKTAGEPLRADVATGADGQSKGFGTVTFASTREAAKAIQALNESEFNGRIIEVRPDAM